MFPSLLFPPPLTALVPTPGLVRKGGGSYSVPPGSCQRSEEASSPRQLHNVCWAGESLYLEFGIQGSHLSPSRLWETAADSPFVGSQETEHLSHGAHPLRGCQWEGSAGLGLKGHLNARLTGRDSGTALSNSSPPVILIPNSLNQVYLLQEKSSSIIFASF